MPKDNVLQVIGGDPNRPVVVLEPDDDPMMVLTALRVHLAESQLSRELQLLYVRAFWNTLFSLPRYALDKAALEMKQNGQELLAQEGEQEFLEISLSDLVPAVRNGKRRRCSLPGHSS